VIEVHLPVAGNQGLTAHETPSVGSTGLRTA
jgi:hypothetical protein